MAGTVHEVENHALLAEVEREAANAAQELVEAARLHRGQIVVIGCSTSEVVGHQVSIVLPAALRVEILKAEHHRPAACAHVQPCKQKCQHIAQVQPPARAGCEAAADRVIRHRSSLRFHTERIIA